MLGEYTLLQNESTLLPNFEMLFCPTCANLLVISSETGYNKWACNTCPYEFPIAKQVGLILMHSWPVTKILQMTSRTRMKRKEVDDVLGGDEMWKHADATDGASLPRGPGPRSY